MNFSKIRFLVVSALALAASFPQHAISAPAPKVSPANVNYLITVTAQDFHDHGTPRAVRFRKVHVGRAKIETGEQYRLKGEFLRGKGKWTPFVTLKMQSYELYLGPTLFAIDPKAKWEKDDLSKTLQKKFDSLMLER